MTFSYLSTEAQTGLRRWATDVHNDELLFDHIGSSTEHWCWIWFQLREAKDRPQWFPKGKWATIQIIEGYLQKEAKVVYETY